MDFYQPISIWKEKGKTLELYPDFIICRSNDLMVRCGAFYAIWDAKNNIWSTDDYDVQRIIDEEMIQYKQEKEKSLKELGQDDVKIVLKTLRSSSSRIWTHFKKTYIPSLSDNFKQLDVKVTFSNDNPKKRDYVSKRLPYPCEEGECFAYEELIGTLYNPEEREKMEWAIGAIIAGDVKDIHKFIVLYGEPGSGKSTYLNIIEKLFQGYYITFDAKSLAMSSKDFSMEMFNTNPLVAIQHEGDLSKIEDNTKLNSIISHEPMPINTKHKSQYTIKLDCFLFIGSNKTIKITDMKSGIIRRLIVVEPSLRKIHYKRYKTLISQIDFELGAIAYHCREVYRKLGKNRYDKDVPEKMMEQTNLVYGFVLEKYSEYKYNNIVNLKMAFEDFKRYCVESNIECKISRLTFKEELRIFFDNYDIETKTFTGFKSEKFKNGKKDDDILPCSLVLDSNISILDEVYEDCLAQYAHEETEIPKLAWIKVKTTLKDIDTTKLHWVCIFDNHIIVDFDLKNDKGEKDLELNIEEASKWPATYAELSKSGKGIHLHYIYNGDTSKLDKKYSEGIEILTVYNNKALRRKLTKCNNISIAIINSNLPFKKEKGGSKSLINFKSVQSENGLRKQIIRNLNKEIHPESTKCSIDMIYKLLDDAYNEGIKYDVTDMRNDILLFATKSTNQSDYCIKRVGKMKFASEESSIKQEYDINKDEIVFFDVEVFPNLFVVCWKVAGQDKKVISMINPNSSEIKSFMEMKLIGFNCRKYDNHILYARYIGYDNLKLYQLSQRLINSNNENNSGCFKEAYNISYTDIYDFASAENKKGLKKWEIDLGIHHLELGYKWDEEVPEEFWGNVVNYCTNDVIATEAVFNHLSGDWAARQILAELSGLTVNDTTNKHTTQIVFGNEKKPQNQFNYIDLGTIFPGYVFDKFATVDKSKYRGFSVGEGGFVYAECGMYSNVIELDLVSGHPYTIKKLNLFGPYTKNYTDLLDGRVAIKKKDYEALKTLLNGKLLPFVEEAFGPNPRFTLKDVSNGLKTALNSAYGLTSASFENQFKDPRNIDNIVAKHEALFMVDLLYAVQEQDFQVVHIKTDSIKIPNATSELIDFIFRFADKYGYQFEHETTYSKFCLINDAVFAAKIGWSINLDEIGKWVAKGKQFIHPYVFKTLFSHEPILFEDLIETRSVKTSLYLNMNEGLSDNENNYHFIGKVGAFVPIRNGCGGGLLCREKEGSYHSATDSKGYRWLEAEVVKNLGKEDDIDLDYYQKLVDSAIDNISKFGSFKWLVSDDLNLLDFKEDYPIGVNDQPPWLTPCGREESCDECVKKGGCGLQKNCSGNCRDCEKNEI